MYWLRQRVELKMLFTVIRRQVWASDFDVWGFFVFCFFQSCNKQRGGGKKSALLNCRGVLIPWRVVSTDGVMRSGHVTFNVLKAYSCQSGAWGAPPHHMEGAQQLLRLSSQEPACCTICCCCCCCGGVPGKHKPSQGAGAGGAPLSHLLCQRK